MSNLLGQLTLWALYFITDVYGHVAFKAISTRDLSLWQIVFSAWGVTAVLSWAASSLLWVSLLANNQLFTASSISTATYAFMILAAALIFKEPITYRQGAGILCIVLGIYLVARA